MIERLLIVGTGLIGASAGLAAKAHGLAGEVVGVSRSEETLKKAKARGAIDSGSTELSRAAKGADFVLVATPVPTIPQMIRDLARSGLAESAVITDAGSTKEGICEAIAMDPESAALFVPAHPIAGSEQSGPEAARADLFEGKPCIVTATADTDPGRALRARDFWSKLGMDVTDMTPEAHDRVVALISHLPHVAAYALMNAITTIDVETHLGAVRYAGTGLLDTTRIAAASPQLWREILENNAAAVKDAVARFRKELESFEHAIGAGDFDAVSALLETAASARRKLGPTAGGDDE